MTAPVADLLFHSERFDYVIQYFANWKMWISQDGALGFEWVLPDVTKKEGYVPPPSHNCVSVGSGSGRIETKTAATALCLGTE